jgi:Ca2+-binding RTX toxin-like protein
MPVAVLQLVLILRAVAVDRIVLLNSTINAASSLDGGASKDTLASQNLNNLSATAVNSTTGFEVLEGVGGAETFDPSEFTSINEFLFTGTSGANNGFTVSDIENTDQIAYSTDITSGGNYALRLAGKNAGNTAAVELRAINETNGETVFTATSNNNDRYGIEIQSNIVSLTINSTGTSTNANVIQTNLNPTYFGYAFGNSSTALFNITGSHDLAIMAKEGVDISDGTKLAGFSDAVSVDATSFTGSLRIAGSLSADLIKGGNNNDIIYGLGGADTLTGNGGADQFRLAKYYNATDTITDFSKGTDKVGLNQFDFGNTTEKQAGTTLSITDYVENRTAITSIGAADALKVIELQTSLSGGQIAADNGAAVEAYVLVHNTTSGKAELWYDNNWSDAAGRNQIVTFDNVVDLVGVQGFSNADFVEYTY